MWEQTSESTVSWRLTSKHLLQMHAAQPSMRQLWLCGCIWMLPHLLCCGLQVHDEAFNAFHL